MKCYMDIIKSYALEKNLDLYEVGGAVRDYLIGRRASDCDFAVGGDCHEIAKDIAAIIGDGSYVNLHSDTARVVLKYAELDFSNLKGKDIYEDILKRDFTINSIAVDIRTGQIIDVLHGTFDIKSKVIRANSDGVFRDDPIRLLRAVRLAGELGYEIEASTRELIKRDAALLKSSAGERIIEEILKIMGFKDSNKYLTLLDELGLLKEVFPIIEPMKVIGKCRFHKVDAYTHSLYTLRCLEDNLQRVLETKWGERINELLSENIGGKPRLNTLKLGAFLHDIGKPGAMTFEGNRVSFRTHDITGKEEFKNVSKSLPMSSKQAKIIEDIIVGHMKILVLYKSGGNPRDIYDFFTQFKENSVDVMLSALFDFTATRELLDEDDTEIKNFWNFVLSLFDKYYTFREKNNKIISGTEIMELTGLQGKKVGELLRRIEVEIFVGNIETKRDAVEFLNKALSESNSNQ